VRCRGIKPDTLGGYLSGIGVLVAASRNWPNIRSCWRDGNLALLHQNLDRESLEAFLLVWRPRPYSRWWRDQQKADTKAKNAVRVQQARNTALDPDAELLDSHIVPVQRNFFNPIFGTGGNIGKRDLQTVYQECLNLIGRASDESRLSWLRATLFGAFADSLPELRGAGTWFVFANKTFNSGQDWYREGQLSPWDFLFALEGARLLSGAASRRLSATSRRYAVFPFVSDPAPAESAQDAGASRAEFWAPLWAAPATLPAVSALFARGQARLQQRAATAPYEFALAARTAGADAGVTAFARFTLRQTTSSQTFEAVPAERVETGAEPEAEELAKLGQWIRKLPSDGGNDPKFYGIRGRIEKALIRIAEAPEQPERWRALLLLLADAQTQIDRNKSLRGTCAPLPLLHNSVFERAWRSLTREIRVAQSIASIGQHTRTPLQSNVFGVAFDSRVNPLFPESRPAAAVWNPIDPLRSMADVLERRLIDVPPTAALPLEARVTSPTPLVHAFIEETLDVAEIGRLIPPLTLIDWKDWKESDVLNVGPASSSGSSRLHDFIRPLFQLAPNPDHPNHAAVARQMLRLVRQASWDQAAALARQRYLAQGTATLLPPLDLQASPEYIAAALLIPMHDHQVQNNFKSWVQPRKEDSQSQ